MQTAGRRINTYFLLLYSRGSEDPLKVMFYVYEDIKLGITEFKCFYLIGFRLVLFTNLRGNEKPEEQER
jgi:hypothetical protein